MVLSYSYYVRLSLLALEFNLTCVLTQPAFTCSKLIIEPLEQGVCEICSKLTIEIPKRHHWRCSGVFIVNFEHISHFVLVFPLLSLIM